MCLYSLQRGKSSLGFCRTRDCAETCADSPQSAGSCRASVRPAREPCLPVRAHIGLVKGTVHPKMKILSASFSCHFKSKFMEHKKRKSCTPVYSSSSEVWGVDQSHCLLRYYSLITNYNNYQMRVSWYWESDNSDSWNNKSGWLVKLIQMIHWIKWLRKTSCSPHHQKGSRAFLLSLCSMEKLNSYGFGITWDWVNEDII